jgi:hypothetical protein
MGGAIYKSVKFARCHRSAIAKAVFYHRLAGVFDLAGARLQSNVMCKIGARAERQLTMS